MLNRQNDIEFSKSLWYFPVVKSYGLVVRPRSINGGPGARVFFVMKELSIFVDESGDFGEYDYHSPYYILSFVFHDQDLDLTSALGILIQKLYSLGLGTAAIHTGPVIRQEEIYNAIDLDTRRKIMRVLLTF